MTVLLCIPILFDLTTILLYSEGFLGLFREQDTSYPYLGTFFRPEGWHYSPTMLLAVISLPTYFFLNDLLETRPDRINITALLLLISVALLTVNKNLPIYFLLMGFLYLMHRRPDFQWRISWTLIFVFFLIIQQFFTLYIPVDLNKTGSENNFVGFVTCLNDPAFEVLGTSFFESIYYLMRYYQISILDSVGFWGIGLGNSVHNFSEFVPEDPRYLGCFQGISPQTHNVYLGTFIELGWPGLVALLAAIFLPLSRLSRILKAERGMVVPVFLFIFLAGMGMTTDVEGFRLLWVVWGILSVRRGED